MNIINKRSIDTNNRPINIINSVLTVGSLQILKKTSRKNNIRDKINKLKNRNNIKYIYDGYW